MGAFEPSGALESVFAGPDGLEKQFSSQRLLEPHNIDDVLISTSCNLMSFVIVYRT